MKNRYFRILLSVSVALSFAVTLSFAAAPSYPFQSGEDMEIIIHYKWGVKADIAAIQFTFREIQETGKEPYFHLVATASTYPFWDSVFKVRDVYESKFSVKDLGPIYFHRDVNEGKYWAKNWYSWSDDQMSLRTVVDKKGRVRRDTTFNEGVVIRDVVNLFYSVRTLDFEKLQAGEKVYFTVAIDRNVVDLMIRMVGKEQKNIQELGTFNTVKLAVGVKARNLDHSKDEKSQFDFGAAVEDPKEMSVFYGEKIYMWFSDDQNRLPLYFSAPVTIGSINGRVSKITGVKYPITSLISPAK
ncbi:MAG: DUF3108 domain-containing protein [Bacteroidales bacterium]|nr:DUF3108 domain-containing protein [Bacteroidales bacterium]MDD3200369.1 DUF3108 domain-containing protein [Bacteroidales bacterium]